jgi:hypothetical protein
MLQRIALYSTLAVLLNALAITFESWAFWCVIGLFWACEQLSRMELVEQLNQELEALRRRNNNNNDSKDSNDNNT